MAVGKYNIGLGLLFLAGFMVYGFVLIYLCDFASGKEEWIAQYSSGTHFESRLAHVHGNLFALLNVAIGYLLMRFNFAGSHGKWVSGLGLAGMLMPLGIVAEILLGAPPIFVLLGGVSMVVSITWLGVLVLRMK